MISNVIFYVLSNDAIITFNWYIYCIRLKSMYWIDLVSFIIDIIVLNCLLWPWVKALWYWVGWFSREIKVVWWSRGMLPYFLYFYVNYTSIMVLFVWSTYACGAIWVDGLVDVTLCNMMIMALLALLEVLWWFV